MGDGSHTSPRDRWLACNPDKTAGDWAELIRQARARKELAELDGYTYLTDEERRRKARDRQRLCRERRKRREAGGE